MNISLLFNPEDKKTQLQPGKQQPKLPDKLATIFPTEEPVSDTSESKKITQLFAMFPFSEAPRLTRSEILKLFTVQPDKGLISAEAKKADVFTEDTLIPASIVKPEMVIAQAVFPRAEKSRAMSEHTTKYRREKKGRNNESIPDENVSENIATLFKEVGNEQKKESYGHKLTSIDVLFKEQNKEPEKEKTVENPFMTWSGDVKAEEKVWYYKDLKGDVQGPFSSVEMNLWNKAGYLFKNLMISFKDKLVFHPLETILSNSKDLTS